MCGRPWPRGSAQTPRDLRGRGESRSPGVRFHLLTPPSPGATLRCSLPGRGPGNAVLRKGSRGSPCEEAGREEGRQDGADQEGDPGDEVVRGGQSGPDQGGRENLREVQPGSCQDGGLRRGRGTARTRRAEAAE